MKTKINIIAENLTVGETMVRDTKRLKVRTNLKAGLKQKVVDNPTGE